MNKLNALDFIGYDTPKWHTQYTSLVIHAVDNLRHYIMIKRRSHIEAICYQPNKTVFT